MHKTTRIGAAVLLALSLPIVAGTATAARKVVDERDTVTIATSTSMTLCGVTGEMTITGDQRFRYTAWDNGHTSTWFAFHARVLDADGHMVATATWNQIMDQHADAWPLTATTVEVVRCTNGSDGSTACSAHLTYDETGRLVADAYSCD